LAALKVGIHISRAPSCRPCSTAYGLRPPVELLSGTPENIVMRMSLMASRISSTTGVTE
jgi:hypothetical protein